MSISVNDGYTSGRPTMTDKYGYYGFADISEVYAGTNRIKNIYVGENNVFSAEDINELFVGDYDRDYGENITDLIANYKYIYSFRNYGYACIDVTSGYVSFITNNTLDTVSKLNGSLITNFCTNGSLILATDYYNKYVLFNISTGEYSEVNDITAAPDCSPCCIDETYSYFGYKNTLIRINNTTKESTTFTNTINLPRRMIADSNYVYILDSDAVCHVFDKNTSTFSQFTAAPSGVSYGNVAHSRSYCICQNDRYIYQLCKYSDGNYNRILVIDKVNKTASLSAPIAELPVDSGANQVASVTCSDEYLFVASYTKIYIFKISDGLSSYRIVDITKYRDSNPVEPAILSYCQATGDVIVAFDKRIYKKHQSLLYLNA